jgi:hypothetical protein
MWPGDPFSTTGTCSTARVLARTVVYVDFVGLISKLAQLENWSSQENALAMLEALLARSTRLSQYATMEM